MSSYSATVVTVSDSASEGRRDDVSGSTAGKLLQDAGFYPVGRVTVPDEGPLIEQELKRAATDDVDLVITSGGTGFGPRDVTPEATLAVIDREAPGLAELMRAEGVKKTPFAALSRGVCGTIGRTLIVNLPGSPKAVEESLTALLPLLPHVLQTLIGDTRHSEST